MQHFAEDFQQLQPHHPSHTRCHPVGSIPPLGESPLPLLSTPTLSTVQDGVQTRITPCSRKEETCSVHRPPSTLVTAVSAWPAGLRACGPRLGKNIIAHVRARGVFPLVA
ncbi:unnamed protein product [Protopolystoma xenopodis]|uniref:Uncharacterized protein n=1 Tax=Protopolystoma xenopodis TaxID=117903 RepID=A0A448WSQ9_9PLAT|nr:unnamed protein product [Protopolystoma xenopodis]